MRSVRVGGHRYSDPDIISLIGSTGELVDPISSVLTQARRVNAEYRQYDRTFSDPLQRVKIIASMQGIKVVPMNIEGQRGETRDAILIPTTSGKQILYNPTRPKQRVAFSIAHEIAHTFFPNSICGARFRNIHESGSREAGELERLCHLGAAEILMPIEDFQDVAAGNYGLTNVETLATFFGSSIEATVYRLATAHPDKAVAGLLQYRTSDEQQRLIAREANQRSLFPNFRHISTGIRPKYRRQSCHLSQACDDTYFIPWNKSFDVSSSLYESSDAKVKISFEELPNESGKTGRLETMLAPFQRRNAHNGFGDLFFFWEEIK